MPAHMLAVNWEMWGALGQWAGAIATFLAVVVALKTTVDASRVRLRIEISSGLLNGRRIVLFTATNVGQRPMQIVSMGVMDEDEISFVPIAAIGRALPAVLEESQRVEIPVDPAVITTALRNRGWSGETRVRVYFGDSRGKRHWRVWRYHVDESRLSWPWWTRVWERVRIWWLHQRRRRRGRVPAED